LAMVGPNDPFLASAFKEPSAAANFEVGVGENSASDEFDLDRMFDSLFPSGLGEGLTEEIAEDLFRQGRAIAYRHTLREFIELMTNRHPFSPVWMMRLAYRAGLPTKQRKEQKLDPRRPDPPSDHDEDDDVIWLG